MTKDEIKKQLSDLLEQIQEFSSDSYQEWKVLDGLNYNACNIEHGKYIAYDKVESLLEDLIRKDS